MAINKISDQPAAFVKYLVEVCQFRRNRPVETKDKIEVHYLNTTKLYMGVGYLTPFIVSNMFSTGKALNFDDLTEIIDGIKQVIEKGSDHFAFLVTNAPPCKDSDPINNELRENNIAILDRSIMQRVHEARDDDHRCEIIAKALGKTVDRQLLSPYNPSYQAIGGRFFGRKNHVREVLNGNETFAVVGTRRIGKTSFLKHIKLELGQRDPKTKTAYINCAGCSTAEDVLLQILREVDPQRGTLVEKQRTNVFDRFKSIILDISEKEKNSVVVFLDEIDYALDFDSRNRYSLMNLLRSLFHKEPGRRIVFAGFRTAAEAYSKLGTPFYNFGQFIELYPFDRQETLDMIVRPLKIMNVPLPSETFPEEVYRETTGHPEMIKQYCHTIINLYEKNNTKPKSADVLSEVFESSSFNATVIDTFIYNNNPIEKLCCYLLMAEASKQNGRIEEYEFGVEIIDELLCQIGIEVEESLLSRLITNLKFNSAIRKIKGTQSKYKFAVPQLGRHFLNLNINWHLNKARKDLEKFPSPEAAIISDIS